MASPEKSFFIPESSCLVSPPPVLTMREIQVLTNNKYESSYLKKWPEYPIVDFSIFESFNIDFWFTMLIVPWTVYSTQLNLSP